MSLRVTSYSRGRQFVVLSACPVCGYEFAPEERRHVHLGSRPRGLRDDAPAVEFPMAAELRELAVDPADYWLQVGRP